MPKTEPPPKRRRIPPWLVVVVALVAVLLFGPLPYWMLAHSPRSYRRCLLRNVTPLPGADTRKCLFPANAWLWWPSLLPWSHAEARWLSQQLGWADVGHRLQEASKLRPSRSARSSAAEAMAAFVRSAPPSSPATANAFGASLWQVGAWPELVRYAAVLGDRLPHALDAALLTGRLQKATEIALRADWQSISVLLEQQIRRGAWLCLNGQQAGLAVLRAASRKPSLVGGPDASLAARLCSAVLNKKQHASAEPPPRLALDTPSWIWSRRDDSWLASEATALSKTAQLTLQLAQAISLIQAQRPEQAEQLAAKAHRRSRGDVELYELREAAAWVHLAAALLGGRSLEAAAPRTPIIYGGADQNWARLVTLTEQKRAPMRWRMLAATADLSPMVLPAVMYVVGQAAAGAGDVDVWLDAFFHHRTTPIRVHARARAEAARWRGDLDDATRWDKVADELSRAISSPAQRSLARAAQL